jgi:hypothetical protein
MSVDTNQSNKFMRAATYSDVEGCRTCNVVMSAGQGVSIIKALCIYTAVLTITSRQPLRSYRVCSKWLRSYSHLNS